MTQRPIELIHARNLLSNLSTPAFLVDEGAMLVYYNESAAELFGRRFEETGPIPAERWTREFGPLNSDGEALPIEELNTTTNLRHGKPAHGRFCVRSVTGDLHTIDMSALPIVGTDGFNGAMAFLWPVHDDRPAQ